MFLRALPFFFFISTAFALELNVSSRRAQYSLIIDEKNHITLKGRLENLSLAKQRCNEGILDLFKRNIGKSLSKGLLHKTKESRDMTIIRDNQKYYEFSKSNLGSMLENLPREIQRLKIESDFKCKSKKD